MPILDIALSAPWAITPEALQDIFSVLTRENIPTPEVLEQYRAKNTGNGERMRMREGVAILDVQGKLFKRANLFVEISGATSYEILMRDFRAAIDDPAVKAIILNVDSPGGEASGCDELAKAIFGARGRKPIVSFVSGAAASGAYWIATAADEVVVSDLAALGSIGVVLGIIDTSSQDERRGIKQIEFVSSQSPGKRPNVTTDEGKLRVQKMVDDLAQVFIEAVAKHRGVDATAVIQKFGAGGVEIGAKAVSLGMADSIGQFEDVMAKLVTGGLARRKPSSAGGFSMSEPKTGAQAESAPVDTVKIAADAAAQAQARIKNISGHAAAAKMPKLANHLAFETQLSVEEAGKILAASMLDVPAPAAVDETKAKADAAAAFEKQKQASGALGFGAPAADQPADASASWGKAIAKVNGTAHKGAN